MPSRPGRARKDVARPAVDGSLGEQLLLQHPDIGFAHNVARKIDLAEILSPVNRRIPCIVVLKGEHAVGQRDASGARHASGPRIVVPDDIAR